MTADLRRRVSGALVLFVLALGMCVAVPSSGAAVDDRPTATDRVGEGTGGSARVRRWPGRTITYTESLPAKWDPSLRLALDAWNTAGGKLKFKKAKSARAAQLTIGYGETHGYAGYATIGPNKNAYVHLSTDYKRVDVELEDRLYVGRLLTHELGHVVGFDHVGKGCQLMVTFWGAECQVLSFRPGYRMCRWIDKPLLKSFVAAYGGKAKPAPKECPIDPLPAQLENVAFSGGAGAGSPVTITWAPQAAKPGVRVYIYVRAGACPSNPDGNSPDLEAYVSPSAGTWTDPDGDNPGGPHCYLVRIMNKSDASLRPFSKVIARYQQLPAQPSVSNIQHDGPSSRWTFDATWPADTFLVARRVFAADGSCPSESGFDDAYEEYFGHTDTLQLFDLGSTECVRFLTETVSGLRSPSVTATFTYPP